MTGKTFFNTIANSKVDILQVILDILEKNRWSYCIIGGIAVNAYVEPVVSLDLDVVVAAEEIDLICRAVEARFKVECFEHSVNLSSPKSSLRIQLQTDPRYRDFIDRASVRTVLGYKMRVASIEDVLQGKIWACVDKDRRKSKRQKDLADIVRLVEAFPGLAEHLPEEIRKMLL